MSGAGVSETNHGICLGTLLALNNVELDFIAFFERFVPVQLDCRVMDKYIWPVFASDESVALGVVKPLDLPFVLSHRLLPSFGFCENPEKPRGDTLTPILPKTTKVSERLIRTAGNLFIK
jgi:hypothetical protein